jgi:hypothetical protein
MGFSEGACLYIGGYIGQCLIERRSWRPGAGKLSRTDSARFFEGTITWLTAKDTDSSESVVENTLKAFDRRWAVAFPGRPRAREEILLSGLFSTAVVVRLVGMAIAK